MHDIPRTKNGHLYLPKNYDITKGTKILASTYTLPWWVAKGALQEMQEQETFTENDLHIAIVKRQETQTLVDELLTSGEMTRELDKNFEWVYSNSDTFK